MIWYLVRFAQYDKVLWVTKPDMQNYWRTVRGNYFTRDENDLIIGVIVTEDTSDLSQHGKDIMRRVAA